MFGYGGPGHDGALPRRLDPDPLDRSRRPTRPTTIPIPRDLWIEGIAALPQNGKVNEVFADGYVNGDESSRHRRRADGRRPLDRHGPRDPSLAGDRLHWLPGDGRRGRRRHGRQPGRLQLHDERAGHLAGNWDAGHFDKGEIHLDGKQALDYSRARYTSVVAESTDFARSVRQARVLARVALQLGDGGVGAIGPGLGLMDAMEGRVRTDMSVIDLFLLSSHLTSDRRIELSEGPVLTATTNTDRPVHPHPHRLDGAGRLRRHPAVPRRPSSPARPNRPRPRPMRRRRRIRAADLPRLLHRRRHRRCRPVLRPIRPRRGRERVRHRCRGSDPRRAPDVHERMDASRRPRRARRDTRTRRRSARLERRPGSTSSSIGSRSSMRGEHETCPSSSSPT